MIGLLAAGVIGLSLALSFADVPGALGGVIALLGLCLLLFPTLTVVVQRDRIQCFFGLGLVRRQLPMRDIVEVSIARNHWLHGWGLRLIPGGWLWNVSGFDAVELRLQGGKRFRIGTDQPEALYAAIERARAAPQPEPTAS